MLKCIRKRQNAIPDTQPRHLPGILWQPITIVRIPKNKKKNKKCGVLIGGAMENINSGMLDVYTLLARPSHGMDIYISQLPFF